jgi:hypothetical protein
MTELEKLVANEALRLEFEALVEEIRALPKSEALAKRLVDRWCSGEFEIAQMLEEAKGARGCWTSTPKSYDGVSRAEPVVEAPEPAQEPEEGAQWRPEDFEADEEPVKKEPSPAQQAARERSALGAKGARKARASRIRETQRKAVAKAAAAGTEPNYTEGGWFRMPNLALDLIAAMPGPVAKTYMVACRLAEEDGSFQVSHQTLAGWIGNKHRSESERAMRRLVDAGLITQKFRGGPGRPNGYRLASLARVDIETAKAVLAMPIRDREEQEHDGQNPA